MVVFCVAVVLVALAVRVPKTFRDLNEAARANAALDLLDREVGAGNSVFSDQRLLVEARGRIPQNEAFTVALGPPQPGWTDLTESSAERFLEYFLLPRRPALDAPWIICLACDRADYPGAEAVWEGDDGLAILRRAT